LPGPPPGFKRLHAQAEVDFSLTEEDMLNLWAYYIKSSRSSVLQGAMPPENLDRDTANKDANVDAVSTDVFTGGNNYAKPFYGKTNEHK
jgi:hypothetical protein